MSASARVLPRASALRAASSRLTSGLVRPFHSYDHPPPLGAFGDAEKTIFAAAYKHVPEHGFSQKALGCGARDAGYLDISASVIPDGAFGLIRYHLVTQREALAARSQQLFTDTDKPGVSSRVEALAWERLMGNKAVLARWQEVGGIPSPFTIYKYLQFCFLGIGRHGPAQLCSRICKRARQAL